MLVFVLMCIPGHLFVEVNQCLFCLTGIDVKVDDKFMMPYLYLVQSSGMSNNGGIQATGRVAEKQKDLPWWTDKSHGGQTGR